MFTNFSNFTDGFKNFSLDALQDDAQAVNENDNKHIGTDDDVPHTQPVLTPVPEASPATAERVPENEDDEWEWNQEDTKRGRKPSGLVQHDLSDEPEEPRIVPSQPFSSSLGTSGSTLRMASTMLTPVSQATAPEHRFALSVDTPKEDRLDDKPEPRQNVVADKIVDVVAERSAACGATAQGQSEQKERSRHSAHDFGVEQNVTDEMARTTEVRARCITCGESSAVEQEGKTTDGTATDAGSTEHQCAGCREAAAKESSGPAPGEEAVLVTSPNGEAVNGAITAVEEDANHGSHSSQISGGQPISIASVHQGQATLMQEPDDGAEKGEAAPLADCVGTAHQAAKATPDAQALMVARHELAVAQKAASGLADALGDSRAEVQQLRTMLESENDTTRQQALKLASLSDEIDATRMGFRESNEAHQRTAERCHALEQELHTTKQTADSSRAETAGLRGQVNVAVEDRHALEAQLRQLQAGLTEGQEAARQEGRQEVERLEARLKDLLKDRDRKQAELDLQNARRKETREMARDLESQLAAVDRIAQEREAELNRLKEEIVALRKNTGEATDQKNTWSTKYEALERNFKQVRTEGKITQAEVEDLRQTAARVEAEKVLLVERVEVEAAERVTVVSSVTHERDFLLKQVDRLEQDFSDLRREQEAQAATTAARVQTTGVLEEYRTRAQQALKRANEVTGQTASENKRLEAELAKLCAEVDQQRPLWEKSKQLEKLRLAEIAELEEKLASAMADREGEAAAVASLKARLADEEEQRNNSKSSVMRLEAQGKSLKQELQRQQKVLAAARERDTALQKQLANKNTALQAAEDRHAQRTVPSGMEASKSTPAVPAPSMGWDEEKPTPKNSFNAETAGASWRERHSQRESFNSLPSEGESVDVQPGSVGEQLFYVQQLRERMTKEQVEMRALISEVEVSRTAADKQAAKQAHLEKQLEAALLDKTRLQELDSGRNAAINLEYLKNCVVGCLRTSEPSEHARLLPVITTILKLSREEADVIAKNISTRAQHQGSFGGSLPPGADTDGGGGGGGGGGGSWWNKAKPPRR